ncbi:MAG: citramalate synthase [Christensenellales bacterium]
MDKKVIIYDATLREGAQGADASFSVQDKLRVVELLDELGVSYIEAGNPGSNPKDAEFYRLVRFSPPKKAKLVAFGSTCRVNTKPEDDKNVQALLSAQTPAVAIFGKSWDFHVTEILRATLEENLEIIFNTVDYMKRQGKEVVYDAEHFFDGYKNNGAYAMKTLQTALNAGADWLCLCDTNGGCFPSEIEKIVKEVVARFGNCVGIHAHNDTGMAEANAVAAVGCGATMVQATLGGWGERCGNTDIFTVLPNLQLKLGYDCVPANNLKRLHGYSHSFYDLVNSNPNPRSPYVGRCAFTHKGGMHIDGVAKNSTTFEHIDPALVGMERAFLLSEVSGRMAVFKKVQRFAKNITKDSPEIERIIEELKRLEHEGYQFEGAEASFELMVRRLLGIHKPFFSLRGFRVMVNEPALDGEIASAMVQVRVGGADEISAAVGNGPVNALDSAARRALEHFYPTLRDARLSDFKVRVLDSRNGTAAPVRVLIESTDSRASWTTTGVSTDIINASWNALVDSLEYKLLLDGIQPDELVPAVSGG